eukprot:CAMPEP_0172319724 /NCGR_PEP_ID=MMETSP1058-20130122/38513_1 /TAXON_ID=83371 /ORGANISM="Detonula confervacea, Strain CCMP 353" /LENGTH=1134 /DNA_ID=CAMNT_0013034843 /DNA_START=202 /DNA_END=3606 /DNA_ORIENTATION=+
MTMAASSLSSTSSAMTHTTEAAAAAAIQIPQWMIDVHYFRKRLFLRVIEPIIVFLLGPSDDDHVNNHHHTTTHHADQSHRRLGFLPSYVEDVNYLRASSMSFATLTMMYIIMSCILLVFLSCFYHNQKTSPLFVSPRRHRLPKLVPPPLPVDGAFSWVKICLFISDEEIINRVGFDSLIFLRFHRLALRCILKMSVFSFLVLLPLNFTGGGRAAANDLKGYVDSLLFTDFLRFTMANVSSGSNRLWVHCFAAYLLTIIVVRELLIEYNAYSSIRHRYLLSKEPHLRTVLVSNIPRHLRSPRKIGNYFRHVYPEAVKSVTICQNLLSLEKLVADRTGVLAQIEKELLILCRYEKRKLLSHDRLSHKISSAFWKCHLCQKIGVVDEAQDRISKLYVSLEEMNKNIEKEQLRRRRVMRYMDKMGAGEGREDIDYTLASAFDGDCPTWKKALKHRRPTQQIRQQQDESSSYQPPAIGAPRNGDGTVRRNNASATMENPEAEVPPLHGDTDSEVDRYEPFTTAEIRFDLNMKKSRRSRFAKAKKAIRKYSTNISDGSVFGRSLSDFSTMKDENGKLGSIEDHTNEVTDKAFVVMRTYTASTIAIQSMHSSKPGSMEVTTAPEPRDILWENVYFSKGARRTRTFIAELFCLFLITMYIVPVALVSLLVSESALISISPRLNQLDKASSVFSAVIATVQPMCLVGLQQLLPPLFIRVSRSEGIVSFSEAQMKAFSRYFMWQVLNIFLVTSVAGSVFDTLAIIIDTPESAFEMLGNSLPRMSSFFVSFVTIKTFTGLGVEISRMVSIVQSSLLLVLFPKSTLRAKRSTRIGMRAIDDPGWFNYHKILAQDMLVVVISVVFAVVAPIVLIPCAVFCFLSRIVWTHQFLYVYESAFETGGLFWPKIFRRFVFGLIIAQATITGQFILKDARHEAYATIALMFLTYIFLRSTRARYDATSNFLPLEVATVMDISLGHDEELRKERRYERMMKQQHHSPENASLKTNPSEDSESLGNLIGENDPFELAYVQPVIRASSHARPEQPFPPAQLGREEVLLGNTAGNAIGSTVGVAGVIGEDELYDDGATVRVQLHNQHERRLLNKWWKDQMKQHEKQRLFHVLIGEECGTLTCDTDPKPVPAEYGHLV